MSEKKRKKHPIRNFFTGLIVVLVVFLAALFGDFFPGLNDFRDTLLERQAYTETMDNRASVEIPTASTEILIEENTIYYMGESVTLDALSDALEETDSDYITLIDNFATQKTWDRVYTLVADKGFAINEEIAQ